MRRTSYEHTQQVTEHPIPSKMREDTIYLESEEGKPDQPNYLFILCPCGCQTLIALPLKGKGWQISSTDPVTLTPSIYQRRSCGSHFFINQNNVKWC